MSTQAERIRLCGEVCLCAQSFVYAARCLGAEDPETGRAFTDLEVAIAALERAALEATDHPPPPPVDAATIPHWLDPDWGSR